MGFVIHKHNARRLHYDFRLEIDGVLVSWAVPKGPSTDPAVKRYAIRVPNHAISYYDFEGVIPDGHYGAGPVMVWDTGSFENSKKEDGVLVPLHECLKKGELNFFLKGKKLIGAYVLIRMGTEKDWLLIKVKDEYAHKPLHPLRKNRSALTGRTMRQIQDC